MIKLSICDFIRTLEKVYDICKIDNLIEGKTWHIIENSTKINDEFHTI